MHVPYRQAKTLANAGDKVYVAAEKGLFYYDKEFNTTEAITKVDGLQAQQLSTIGYDAVTNTLVIAYANTQVDLLQENKLYNISDIYRKPLAGEKKINSIRLHNRLAYLSTSFGVVVLDLQKREVKETYSNLGPSGAQVTVSASAIRQDSIYLATDHGLLAAPLQGLNLQDFHSWKRRDEGLPATSAVVDLAVLGETLYAATATSGTYALKGKAWQENLLLPNTRVNSIKASDGYLAVATTEGLVLQNKSGQVQKLNHTLLAAPQKAVVEAGVVWVADSRNGLVRLNQDGTRAEAFAPAGPFASDAFRLYASQGKVYAFSGGYDENNQPNGNKAGFYVYSKDWQSYNSTLSPNLTFFEDLVGATFNSQNQKLYIASYGRGLIEWNGPDEVKVYNGSNSPLLSAQSYTEKEQGIRVTDVATDTEGNVWVVNRSQLPSAPGLLALRPDGTWTPFVLPDIADGSNLDQLLLDDDGQKWLSVARRANRGNGLVVFDSEQNKVRRLGTGEGRGGLPDGAVYSMAKDRNGDVWVGTGSGVGVYYNPGYLFESQPYDARIPVIAGRPLLDGQTVRSIAVDGANRKWMGTDNGLWLFSPEGDKLIQHFTVKNSPLPSDKVLSVAVVHETGEVFVATDAGIASYRAGATVTEGKPECAVVFPNPVRRDYTGLIGVSGLPNNADVRITDVSGTLVYKTQATGGTLAWDGRDYNGKRVKAGVYLVLSSGQDGEQTCISKIAVLD